MLVSSRAFSCVSFQNMGWMVFVPSGSWFKNKQGQYRSAWGGSKHTNLPGIPMVAPCIATNCTQKSPCLHFPPGNPPGNPPLLLLVLLGELEWGPHRVSPKGRGGNESKKYYHRNEVELCWHTKIERVWGTHLPLRRYFSSKAGIGVEAGWRNSRPEHTGFKCFVSVLLRR